MYALATTLPFMVCLVWTAILVVQLHKGDLPHRALTNFGIAATLLYFTHYLHFNGMQTLFSESLYYMCNLTVYPLYALFVKCLTSKRAPSMLNALWVVPGVVVFVLSITGVLSKLPFKQDLPVQILFAIISVSATVVAAIDLFRFRKSVENYYSEPDGRKLDPILTILILLFATALASFSVNIMGRAHFMGQDSIVFPAAFFSTLLFFVFFFSAKSERPVEDVRIEENPEKAEEDPNITEGQGALMNKIGRQMYENQIFRQKGLTITDLAEAVGSNRTYVSTCINKIEKQSFSDYIAGWRVRYACVLMEENPPLPLSVVADRSGFADRVSFYRSFKKVTGKSPSDWAQKGGKA